MYLSSNLVFMLCISYAATYNGHSHNPLPLLTKRLLSGVELRIQPLGASITVGYLSSQGYGYRKPLQDLLVSQGVKIDFIGSKQDGNMPNSHNEAKPGDVIAAIATRFTYSAMLRPNVILVHAGTNDLWADKSAAQWAAAPAAIKALLNQIWTSCPDAVLLVAKLVHPKESAFLQRTIDFNNAVTAIIDQYQAAGKHILNSDMTHITSLNADGVHPTDTGYSQMAVVWLASITDAMNRGWIMTPITQYPLAKY